MRRILVVDDEEKIRAIIRKYGEFDGYDITEAKDGMEAVKLCREQDFDVIILDIMMPGISGLKTCEEIRKTSYVPILFLTAKSKESDKLIGFMAGADDYLIKQFSYTAGAGRLFNLPGDPQDQKHSGDHAVGTRRRV